MHNSEDGQSDSSFGHPMLLRADSSTDLCLSCHAEDLGSVLAPDPRFPTPELGGGNFTFLYEDNINDAADGATNPIPGHRAGHNVVSPAWGIPEDPDNSMSPGGSFPASALSCTSCHDPHGNDSFRLLRGQGPVGGTGFTFINPAPTAKGIALDAGPESPIGHTAYQQGCSDWCANCHGYYHDEGMNQGFEHPADERLDGSERNIYNRYVDPDEPEKGDFATAYTPEVPIEDVAMTPFSSNGATTQSRVTCMSCHRAHATSAPASTRWDPNVQFLSEDGLVSGSYPLPDPFNHPQQRALCVKCHYRDAVDHGLGAACMECHRQLEDG